MATALTSAADGEWVIAGTGIRIVEVRIRNFRCLESVDVALDELTILVGENNAGKTSFLEALHSAIGAGTRSIGEEDIYLAAGEDAPPKDRRVTVDVRIRPMDTNGRTADAFPAGSPWLELWGSGVAQDDHGNDMLAIRTQMRWDSFRGEYVTDRRFLRDWQEDGARWEESRLTEKTGAVTAAHIEPLSLYYLDARRDIAEDIRSRSSFWSKMVSDLGLSDEDVAAIEEDLSSINDKIVGGSAVLGHVQSHLSSLDQTLVCDEDSVCIAPVTRHIRDLNKGIDVLMSTKGPQLSLMRQGMGTRSLGTLLAFRAYMEWRIRKARGAAAHPVVGIEEPESHLHPQAQRALYHQIAKMPGQRIVSTHSPYICAQAQSVVQIRHFLRLGNATRVSQIRNGDLDPEDLRKIDRQVMNTRGDIVFARCLLLFEGETEEQAIPAFAEAMWGCLPSGLGVTLVGVNGSGGYLPFLRLAQAYGIPWSVLADGEEGAVSDLDRALDAVSEKPAEENERIKVLKDTKGEGVGFERYLCHHCPELVVRLIVKARARNERHQQALLKEWTAKAEHDLVKELETKKTRYGAALASLVRDGNVQEAEFPPAIAELLSAIAGHMKWAKVAGCDQ